MSAAPAPTRLTEWPPIAVGLVAIAIAAALVVVSDAASALHRPLWLDEIFTQLIAQSPRGVLRALRSGADFQPPLDYFLVRLSDRLAPPGSALTARLPSLVAIAGSVCLLGAMLRTRLSTAAALAGALALAAHPLAISFAAEARPYALWIFTTAFAAWCLSQNRRGAALLVVAAAAAVCSSHYFGVLSIVSMGFAVGAYAKFSRGLSWTATARTVAPLAIGACALLALLPLARAQLAASGGRSWMSPRTASDFAVFLRWIWGWRPAWMLIAAGACFMAARRIPSLAARLPRGARVEFDATLVALLATAAVPVLVALITLLYKPVLVLRYSAPAVLAVATLCALAVEMLPRQVRWLPLLLLGRSALHSYESVAAAARNETAVFSDDAWEVRLLAARGIPTMAPSRHDAYRASWPAGGASAVAWMELSDSLLERVAAVPGASCARSCMLVERDFGRAVKREFGFPEVVSAESARTAGPVALLRDESDSGADAVLLPARIGCTLSSRLAVYMLPAAAVPCDSLRAAIQSGGSFGIRRLTGNW